MSMSSTPDSRCKIAFGLVLLVFTAVYLYWLAHESFVVAGVRYSTLSDDSMISLRYADNLSQGRGLVWNRGERVEGITNLGWTLVMSLVRFLRVPRSETPAAIQLLNLGLHLSLICLVFQHLKERQSYAIALLAAAMIAMNGPLFAYSLGGFESTLQALLVTAALLPFVRAVSQV